MLFRRMGFISLILLNSLCAYANDSFDAMWKSHPFYFGPMLGYGNTDWSMLTIQCDTNDPECDSNSLALATPISAGDSGLSWGSTVGYELKPEWAAEASFIRFPTTTIQFAKDYSYYIDKFNVREIRSSTWAFFAVGKFMTQVGSTGFRGFANAGIDFTSRSDLITHRLQVSPTFGLGINYVFPSRMMLEFGFQYMAGFGRATEIPARFYIPFLYSLHAKLMYRI